MANHPSRRNAHAEAAYAEGYRDATTGWRNREMRRRDAQDVYGYLPAWADRDYCEGYDEGCRVDVERARSRHS